MYRFGTLALPFLLGLGSVAGCQERSRPAVTPSPEPAASPTVAEPPPGVQRSEADQPNEPRPQTTTPQPGLIQPQEDRWAIVREAFDGDLDASCTTQWVRRNRFEVKTDNVRRLTVDMRKLPPGAPRAGPWIIIIDGQGVELTGFQPKPGYTGQKRDLVRTRSGRWSVDRRKLYRPGE